jgi:hypothetical protein
MAEPVQGEWVKCPPGELTRLAKRLRWNRQRRIFLGASAAVSVAGLLLALWLGWPASTDMREYHFAGISCSQVRQLAPKYLAGELKPALREKVSQHLAQCPLCKQFMKDMGMTSGGKPAESAEKFGLRPGLPRRSAKELASLIQHE